ncbi:MAG: DUF4399 domain-containing protein [Cohaesibacteraceae bacterium]
MRITRKTFMSGATAALLALGGAAYAMQSEAPADAEAYIISPASGETVSNPVTVVFGLRGMGIAPAGVEQSMTGHHHLLINQPIDELDLLNPLPADDRVRHFGGGQTEVTLELPAGTHTLQLLLGDHNHIPHDPVVASEVITVTVE